jgi:hypothetical protein
VRLKLDENIGARGVELFLRAGHDVATVTEQGLSSSRDENLLRVCVSEKRCLVTLDLGFSNPLVFKPSEYEGIVVLRLPPETRDSFVGIWVGPFCWIVIGRGGEKETAFFARGGGYSTSHNRNIARPESIVLELQGSIIYFNR